MFHFYFQTTISIKFDFKKEFLIHRLKIQAGQIILVVITKYRKSMLYKILKVFLILGLVMIINTHLKATSLYYGLPGIRNFSRTDYAGGIQNWSFCETDNGLLYFANTDGLLEFNGANWTVYQSIKAANRAVCADGNRVYVGAYGEFGFFEENKTGTLEYHSLVHLIKGKVGDFDEIWHIYKTSFGVVFQSFKAIFIYQNEKIDIVYPRSSFHFSFYVNGILWVYDEEMGLMQYRDGKVRLAPGGDFFIGTRIWSVISLNDDEILIGTSKKGVFRYNGINVIPWKSEINENLKRFQIYSAKRLNNNYFAFGTIQNGLIVTDTAGKLVFEVNKERGLQNNTILDIGQDKSGNIWLCLDNGISMLEFDSPVSFLQNYFDIGTGYASARFGDYLYLGTNQGLFYIKWNDFSNPSKLKTNFRLIEGTEGQVWNLSVIDNALFCGHHNGVFQVSGNQATKISSEPGAWNFLRLKRGKYTLVGNYQGLSILENNNGSWQYRNSIKGFNESSRFVQSDQAGNIWVSHPYKGIFKLKPDSLWRNIVDVKLFTSKDGLPSDWSNLIFKTQNEIVVATINGIYGFDDIAGKFEVKKKYISYFEKGQQIDFFHEDKGRNIWFYAANQFGVLRLLEDGSFKKIVIPFSKLNKMILPGFEHINEIDPNNILIGIEGGFANYVSKFDKDYTVPSTIYISDLRSRDTAEGIFRFNSKIEKQAVIPAFQYSNNTISISFASNNFEMPEVDFQYRLIGFDKDWSEWTTKKFKEYTNLPPGNYTFELRAGSNNQVGASLLSYKFEVLPPWYRSEIALVIYFILFLLLLYYGQRYLSRRIEKLHKIENQKQKEKYQGRVQVLKEEALIAEKEMERLRNERLNLEMIHKEKELANSTMLLIMKNNILNKLQTDLQSVNLTLSNDEAKNNISVIIKRIEKEIDNEKQWKVFNLHIEQVYEELFKKLKESYPELTPRELSLCAYLRMNISSKEIATLMNISPRGVEISRYRIRKKLKLEREANLTEFMINL